MTRSTSETKYEYQGTGFNPEGPAGVEGQTAPAYKDLQNMVGKATQTQTVRNEEINKRTIDEERSPSMDRVTVSVNIDAYGRARSTTRAGRDTSRRYHRARIPVRSAEDLKAAESLIQNAIGFDAPGRTRSRFRTSQFDRTAQFRAEDAEYLRKQQIGQIILFSLIGLAFSWYPS